MTLEETLRRLNKNRKEEDKVAILGDTEIIRTTTSTGSPYLDYITGGGFMNGGYNSIVATGGVGKSSIALLSCVEVIKKGLTAVYFDGESTLNESYFQRMGVSKKNFIHRRIRNLEDMLDEAELFSQTDGVGIIVFDSIPIFVATAVEGKSAGENTIGIEAKRFTARMPIIEGYASARDICLLGLTSYKKDPGAMGDPRVLPRGEWQKTMNNTFLDLTKKELLKDDNGNIIGHTIDVRVKKSKNAQYNGSQVYNINFYNDGGFNVVDEFARLFLELNIVKQGGAWISFANIDGEEVKVQGVSKFIEYLKENEEDFENLKKYISQLPTTKVVGLSKTNQ